MGWCAFPCYAAQAAAGAARGRGLAPSRLGLCFAARSLARSLADGVPCGQSSASLFGSWGFEILEWGVAILIPAFIVVAASIFAFEASAPAH